MQKAEASFLFNKMLSKTQRISTNRFGEIVNSGKSLNFGAFYVKYLLNSGQEGVFGYRFAVAVPKKAIKGAIKRHFVKRRVFNALKSNSHLFPTTDPKDIVIFANKDFEKLSLEEVDQNIKNLLQKVASLS